MSPRKTKRCHWYDDDGTPRPTANGKGCTRRDCMFVHPQDAEWAWAIPSHAPPGYEPRAPERERAQLRGPSTYSNLSRPPGGSSSNPFADLKLGESSLRKSSMDSLSSRSSAKIASSSTRPSTSDPRERPSRTSISGTSVGDLRASSTERREESRSEKRPGTAGSEKSDGRSVERKDSISSTSRAGPSKAAPSSEAMPPPPAKPVSRADGKKPLPLTRNPTVDAWVNRIKELASAVSTRVEYLKVEEDLAALRRMTNSRQMADFSSETRRRLEKQRDQADERLQAKREELNDTVRRLIDADYWPVPPRPFVDEAGEPHTSEEKFREVRLGVWELRDRVKEISEKLESQKAREPSVSKESAKATSRLSTPTLPAVQSDAMQVDEPRPTKRRRLSEDRGRSAERSSHTGTIASQDFDAFLEEIRAFEVRLSDVENELVTFDQDMTSSLDYRLEERLANLHLPSSSNAGEPEGHANIIDTGQLSVEVQNKLRDLVSGFDQTGNDIEEVAGEVGSIITHMTSIDAETARLKARNEALEQQVTALEERQKATDEMLKAQKAEIKALNAALTAYISKPPDPVPPPILPDIGTIVEALRPSLMTTVREEITPMLRTLRDEVERILRDHTAELSGTVMAKLVVVLQTQSAIQDFLETKAQDTLPSAPANDAVVPHANGVPNGVATVNGAPSTNGAESDHTTESHAPS